ncbi:Indoleamine 2,3-dioxygenase [Marasmius fiardii PR-910]|nr:Indoleamine 2,3-dioxygenase [Marasmius fiardii PR-910]
MEHLHRFFPANTLPPDHFLTQPRPESITNATFGTVDTTTLAAHDFDVDNRSGFMPPQEPVGRLPVQWEAWETVLDAAIQDRLQLGERVDQSRGEREKSSLWRARVRELPILPTTNLKSSELMLRRAHIVLAWILHFYVHSLPPDDAIKIPPPVTIPLLQVSNYLQLPPVLTYSDNVLYNWTTRSNTTTVPHLNDLQSRTLFTSSKDEEEFFLTSARIELRGVEALSLMRSTMDELFVGDEIAVKRITAYLTRLASVIEELSNLLTAVRDGCDPETFYNEIRPWLKGADSNGRPWEFEGLDRQEAEGLEVPTELSGPSAGQSSLVHAMDTFLGVLEYSHSDDITGSESSKASTSASLSEPSPSMTEKQSFLARMQLYMPRHHRNFLNHLRSTTRPLRQFVIKNTSSDGKGAALLDAYNRAITALKELRDQHIIIVSLYIIGPARRAALHATGTPRMGESANREEEDGRELKGTGGTNLVRFLKDVRDGTKGAAIHTTGVLH